VPGSSVGIATGYGLDSPRSNSGGDEIFRLSRPALGPTQPPVKWVPGLSRGDKVWLGHAADHSPPSSAAVMEEYSYTSNHPLGHTGPVTGTLYITSISTSKFTALNNLLILSQWTNKETLSLLTV